MLCPVGLGNTPARSAIQPPIIRMPSARATNVEKKPPRRMTKEPCGNASHSAAYQSAAAPSVISVPKMNTDLTIQPLSRRLAPMPPQTPPSTRSVKLLTTVCPIYLSTGSSTERRQVLQALIRREVHAGSRRIMTRKRPSSISSPSRRRYG